MILGKGWWNIWMNHQLHKTKAENYFSIHIFYKRTFCLVQVSFPLASNSLDTTEITADWLWGTIKLDSTTFYKLHAKFMLVKYQLQKKKKKKIICPHLDTTEMRMPMHVSRQISQWWTAMLTPSSDAAPSPSLKSTGHTPPHAKITIKH